jgi:hypothetical protein
VVAYLLEIGSGSVQIVDPIKEIESWAPIQELF